MKHIGTTGLANAVSRLRLLALALVLPLALVRPGFAAGVTAEVDHNIVTLGERLTLTLKLDGLQVASNPALPAIPNFQVDSGFHGFESKMVGNSIEQRFQYALIPTKAGDFTIPGLPFPIGGQVYTTQPIPVKVVKPGSAVPGSQAEIPAAFGKVEVPGRPVYVGEVFPIEIQLYVHSSRMGVLQQASKVFEDGFRLNDFRGPIEKDVQEKGQTYRVKGYRAIATAVKPGTFNSGPVSMVMVFGRLNFFGGFSPESQHRLAADPVTIQVLPVPTASVPPNYNGALGTFSLKVSAGPTNVTVGDPITVNVEIAGRGQFEALALPAQAAWREFKTYPATSSIVTNDGLGIGCTKTFEQVVIPQNHEIKALPPFVFSFFDPEAKAYRTLASPAFPLNVRPSANAGGPLPTLAGITNKSDRAEKPPEITTIKVHLGALSPVQTPLFQQGWFLALQLAPPILWLSFFARRRYKESLSRNPRLLRQREVARIIAEGWPRLQASAAANEADEFFATLFRLLQEQIGERLDVPASAITEAVVDERLRPLGLEAETLAQLHALFQECNLARYAAARTSGELNALLPKVEEALAALQQLPNMETK